MPSVSQPGLPLKGLYVILDPEAFGQAALSEVLTTAARAGARLFQYRDKRASMKEAFHMALALRKAAEEVEAIFIVNDRCDLALAVGADGVHLGQDDLPLAYARAIMGPEKIIGISTHNLHQVKEATSGGANYIGFGPIFRTGTKRDHEPVVGIEGLRLVRAHTPLPIFAIGGLTREQTPLVLEAGANGIAVVSALAKAQDIEAEVRNFLIRAGSASPPAS